MQKMHGLAGADNLEFGVQLSPENIESVIRSKEAAAEFYQQNNQAEIQRLQEMVRSKPIRSSKVFR